MTESEFLTVSDALLEALQRALDSADLDVDYQLNGGVLEIEFDSGEKMIVNRHAPNQEIWVAARTGGYHFSLNDDQRWINRRDQSELAQLISQLISDGTHTPFHWS
jgi:CyaY protein